MALAAHSPPSSLKPGHPSSRPCRAPQAPRLSSPRPAVTARASPGSGAAIIIDGKKIAEDIRKEVGGLVGPRPAACICRELAMMRHGGIHV